MSLKIFQTVSTIQACDLHNDHIIGWQKINPLSHPDATLAPQAMKEGPVVKNLNYVTLAPHARQARPNCEIYTTR